MFIRIYFDNRPLFLCDAIDNTVEPYLHHDDAIFIDEFNTHTVKSMLHEMDQPAIHAGVFLHPDLDALKKAFFKKFNLVKAAGGLVENEEGDILLMYRRGSWDLPKGKLDEGEDLPSCALREVKEETGLSRVEITGTLPITYHTYREGTRHILKETHWFRMLGSRLDILKPQGSEQITDLRWVNPNQLDPYLANSFPSIIDVLNARKT